MWHQKSIFVSDFKALTINIVQLDFSTDKAPEREQQLEAEQIQHYVYELPECTSSLVKYSRAEQKEGVRVYLGSHRETLVGLSNVFILVRS